MDITDGAASAPPAPVTGQRNGGDLVVETLSALGATTVFGIPGQHALGLFDAIERQLMTASIYRGKAIVGGGVPMLGAGRWMVRAMGAIYGGILAEIERRGYDVFSARAFVPGSRKLRLLAAAAVPSRTPPVLPPLPVVQIQP